MPAGTLIQKTARQSMTASRPPATSPMNWPARSGDLIGAEGEAALLGEERVGQDGGRVGDEHRSAERLDDPLADEPERAMTAVKWVEGEQDGRDGKDDEVGVAYLPRS